MVMQLPNLTLTLEALAPSGLVLAAEQQAALQHSLPVKQAQAGFKTLNFWGKISARNGKDYLIAEGSNGAYVSDKRLVANNKYCFSQDAITWVDLEAIGEETASRAGSFTTQLSGEPSKMYAYTEPGQPAAEPKEGEEAPPPNVTEVSELQRLRHTVDQISEATGVVPKGTQLLNATNSVVPNHMFSGLAYPDKLEGYAHAKDGPDGPSLAEDVRGIWSLHHDSFKGTTVCRSLLWPGYVFYYSAATCSWGGLYMGSGQKNNDLIFML
ncbi:hypothetical protein WJX72_007337 [[Myrmecia] bisecta]|uniref:Radial spoke head protein 9 homolog n=1 Tax=[Myrmecia] bisecta TaxID=41462 RepID=A0AAW1QRI8_9CHLO